MATFIGVKDWQSGAEVFGEIVAVRDLELRPPGTNKPQIMVTVFDVTGERKAASWNLPESQVEFVKTAVTQTPPLIRVYGIVNASGKYPGQLTIKGVSEVTAEEGGAASSHDFLEPLPVDHAQLIIGLDHLIERVRHPLLAALLARTIGKEGKLRERYLQASAARHHHHAYPGGLLRHSLEVTEFALHTARRFPGLHTDLLIAGGLLHDIGKVFEMDHEWKRGEYTDAGELLGHIYLGAEWVSRACRDLKFPEPLRLALAHLILAHHDELEFGSPVQPKTAEAITLAKCDQISAELTAFFKMRNNSGAGQRTHFVAGRSFFIGELWSSEEGADPLLPPLTEDPEDRLLRRLAAWEVRTPQQGIVCLPILGRVAAGDGIRSSDASEPERRDVLIPPAGADFLLQVTGDSMIGAGIQEGDLLHVRRQDSGKPGQIVVAFIPGAGSVVKRLERSHDRLYLVSENPVYAPIPVTDGVIIQGTVTRVERDLP